MAYRVVWSEAALSRAAEFLDFIARDNPAAARRVIRDLFDRVAALADQPRMGRRLSATAETDLRRLVAGKYIVVYQIHEPRKTITVVAARHSRERLLSEEESPTP
ncbi:type II toxin-antitoxin system RelE/ParE family toxin [bacterium]|nr:MAG: type II toxin-antitoxin system RelE/ParE family toxin [bacterium]